MQDSPQEANPPAAARPLNRWGIGTLSIAQTVLLAITLVAANYLSMQYYSRLDLSRAADYTLSQSTRSYLRSEAVSGREKPIKWIMAMRRTSPFYERVRALAEEYERLAKGRIDLEAVDPMRSPDRMQEITAGFGISLARDMIIIDARTDDRPAVTENAEGIRVLHPHVKIVIVDDMGVFSVVDRVRKITAFQGEDLLTSRLVESIEGRPRRMALIADKSRLSEEDGGSSWRTFEDTLRFQNIELVSLQLAGLEKIPDDVSGVVLAAPKYDFSESEIAVLEQYWMRSRAALLVLVDGGEVPSRLRAFLRSNGVTPRKDRVIAREGDRLVTAARGVFTRGVSFTADLAGQATEFGGASSSLDVREGAEDLLNRQIHPMGLVEVAPGFWGETDFGKGQEKFDEARDNRPPLHLAAAVIRGAESDDRFAADTARMLVVSNTDFLDQKNHRAENLDFLASSANWLVGREELAGIGPRSLGIYRLPLLESQVSFINRVNLFFLPVFLLVIGAFVWSSRRV